MNKDKIPKYLQLGYIDNCIEQTMLWMNGKSVHMNDECVVDFSCCYPDMLTEERKRLSTGNEKISELINRRKSVLSNSLTQPTQPLN